MANNKKAASKQMTKKPPTTGKPKIGNRQVPKSHLKSSEQDYLSAAFGTNFAHNASSATDAMHDGMGQFRQVAETWLNSTNGIKGYLFEAIEVAKFNEDAALHGSRLHAALTAAMGGAHDPADIVILDGNNIVDRFQAKASESSTRLTSWLADPKYNDMEKLVPSDKVETVRNYAQGLAHRHAEKGLETSQLHEHTANHVTGKLGHDAISSDGTTMKELSKAAENPDGYANSLVLGDFAREAGTRITASAGTGFVVGTAVSAIRNFILVQNGKMSLDTAINESLKAGGKSALRAGTVASIASGLRVAGQLGGISLLKDANAVTAISSAVLESGVVLYKYSRGEVTIEEVYYRIGRCTLASTAGYWAGMAAGSALGPIGSAIGSTAGYIVAGIIYDSAATLLKNAKLAEKEAEILNKIADDACEAMRQQRIEFKTAFEKLITKRQLAFINIFDSIENSIETESYEDAMFGLAKLADIFGSKILTPSQIHQQILSKDPIAL